MFFFAEAGNNGISRDDIELPASASEFLKLVVGALDSHRHTVTGRPSPELGLFENYETLA